MQQLFIVQKKGFTAAQPDVYVLKGIFKDNYCGDHYFRAFYGMEELEVKLLVQEGTVVYRRYQSLDDGRSCVDREYFVCIRLPRRQNRRSRMRIFECQGRERVLLFQPDGYFLKKERERLNANFDGVRYLTEAQCGEQKLKRTAENKRFVEISGWVLSARPFSVEVYDGRKTALEAVTQTAVRKDIEGIFPEFFCGREGKEQEISCGFRTVFEMPDEKITVRLTDGCAKQEVELEKKGGEIALRQPDTATWAHIRKFYGERGMSGLLRRCLHSGMKEMALPAPVEVKQPCYQEWRVREDEKRETPAVKREGRPLFSVVVPLFLTKQKYLEELVSSVQAQTYSMWELCLSDGGGEASELGDYLCQLCESDTRIRIVKSAHKLGISENTNAALAIASGDYIVFSDHDDLLHPEALAECAARIQVQPETDLIYTDEDKVSVDGTLYFQPHFKPDYNKELLHSMNYFCHLVVVKRSLLQRVGLLDTAFDGAQDYDLVLRCVEKAKRICHIPRVLYHWRAHLDSTAENPQSKRYAFEAGKRALNAHYQRCGIPAKAEPDEMPGMYRKIWERTENMPLLSVIVHGTEEKKKAFLYSGAEVICAAGTDAAALNEAARRANGELLLFWDGGLKEMTRDGLYDMAQICCQDDVATVGPKVIYTDGRIRQCGVIFERDGGLYRAFEGFEKEDMGYFARINTRMEISILLKECLMVRRSLFEKLGGFDTAFQKDYFDADFCLRARKRGMRNVYCPTCVCSLPYALREEISLKERNLFTQRWKRTLAAGDPNYNPNLSARCADYSLRLH